MEEEQLRLLEEHRRLEDEKLRKAIEENEQKEEEERAKREEELRLVCILMKMLSKKIQIAVTKTQIKLLM